MIESSCRLSWLTALMFVVVFIVPQAPASATPTLVDRDRQLALLFCSYVRANDSIAFRNKLRDFRLRIRNIYSSIRCNDKTMIQFAAASEAYEIGSMIATRVPSRDLRTTGDAQWAAQKPHSTNPIVHIIQERLDLTPAK